ncbi:hypothetical protein J2847_005676 [Azospirillum agricola]|uniref:hypothetical protein n=1 Tax=Azospirillum agricola TaxID=1720247 RepID=UPI001AEAD9C5|nr:hypothetical protein [Azospirillum agricola]MBP2232351.1 hypothetical protein [Azospirillum agricola]
MLLTMALTSVVLEAARLDRPRDPPARPAAGREPFRLAYAPVIVPKGVAGCVPNGVADDTPGLSFRSAVMPALAVPARVYGRVLVED